MDECNKLYHFSTFFLEKVYFMSQILVNTGTFLVYQYCLEM